ncbi:hypothetical protein J5N97_002023 [Dioscorea zingiberensis]|uniref:Serpin domain-containing protein n=1 Tax=Dioscorea zingiberensis TaxID=325984 RepID=A0A9D5BTA1_9LILI|nr:hypothetical protein J5N97_002023 [Dioscorea zingiberensis]
MASRKGVKRARSPEPASFTESKKLRKAINNQTQVAMEITEKLLLTEGKEQNMVYSPLSIHVVLSMIAAGTKGLTKDQLLSFLKSKSINELNDLASNVAPLVFADGSPRGGPCLSFANGVWVEQSCPVKPSFKDVVDTAYKAALKLVDFKTGLRTGLKLPFVPGGEDPFINTILQKSCIEVNIDGTEAAAVTVGQLATVGARRGPPKPPPITFCGRSSIPFSYQRRSNWNRIIRWACPQS